MVVKLLPFCHVYFQYTCGYHRNVFLNHLHLVRGHDCTCVSVCVVSTVTPHQERLWGWCSYVAIYVAVVDPCLEYDLHKNITCTYHYTQYTSFSMLFHFSCSSTMHIACSTHIHTGETVLVVYLSIHLFIPQSVCLSICSSFSLPAYPSVHPSVCLSIHLFIHQSACLSICSSLSLSVQPSVHPSVYLSIHLFIHQSICLSICSSISLSIHLFIPQSVCLSICSSISLPVYSSVCLSICLSVIQIKPSF